MHLKMGQYAEAEAAFNKAQSKLDVPTATSRSNIPELYAAAQVDQGFGNLWMAKASKALNPEEQMRDQEKACGAYKAGLQIRGAFAMQYRFSPSEFPIADAISAADYRKRCETVTLLTGK